MQIKRLLCKSCTLGTMLVAAVWILALLLYSHNLNSSINTAGWKFNKSNASPRAELSYQARVTSGCTPSSSNTSTAAAAVPVEPLELLGVVRNKQDKYIRDIGYKHHAFNALVSNNIGLYREIPDTRHKVCDRSETSEAEQLPQASVIMCFYNEHKMTLMRSVRTVLERTPSYLLKEIVLVDDHSDLPELEFHLHGDLRARLKYDNLRYVKNNKREGLIRSRVIGAREAVGDVLVFLDSHIEVKGFWKKGSSLQLQPCRRTPNQLWYETEKSEIILDKLLCLEASGDSQVIINKCHEMLGDQQWRHTRNSNSPVYNMAKGTCLRAASPAVGALISLDLCSKTGGLGGAWDIVQQKKDVDKANRAL
ncbi:GL21271 [Drosophila persimilis]|uniref:Polypeptide N-acetylgalactosaminyltransferase n=1 Tax=Drosophila persimilis TaxID=7234 RepID=B4GX78_DROPE|nr:GL21271 [Drosophila persimilis]